MAGQIKIYEGLLKNAQYIYLEGDLNPICLLIHYSGTHQFSQTKYAYDLI